MTDPLDAPLAGPNLPPGRRRALHMLASLPLAAGAGAPRLPGPGVGLHRLPGPSGTANPFPHGATFLVGGPAGGPLHRWARTVAPVLAQGLPPETRIGLTSIGGGDGVTAANRFAAGAAPDGRTLLFGPGAAMLAWLIGEGRAKFDVGSWVPVLAAATPAALVGRISVARLRAGATIRMAVDHLPGPDLAGLLALSLLGGLPVPVPGLSPQAAEAALAQGRIDVLLVSGAGAAARVHRLLRRGAHALASFGIAGPDGALHRDPAFPSLAQVGEVYARAHGHPPAGPLFEAWRATASVARLVFAVDLPPLTPAAMVALWRGAANAATGQAALAASLAAEGARALSGPEVLACARSIAVGVPALLALRRWLSARHGWLPG